MNLTAFLQLSWNSVVAPRDVARQLISLRLGQEALLLAFALVVVLNALLFGLTVLATPTSGASQSLLSSPLFFMILLGGALAITIVALTWVGRMLGGAGRIEDIAVLLIWMQALRVLVQIAMLVLLPLSMAFSAILVLAASVAGVWMLVHFIDEAHGFGNLLRALLVLILAVTGTALGLALFMSLIGATTMGLNGYV
ncbi:YIP1 family protein [Puniceibacterium sediminis]|uniref:Yip1 domain-containing protein n=1 Tax=Puniceibacterium sediminis TaxID=1608407 RepID=A0A238W4R8_9RHOB|nr:YIP1 family protein [Puniceibacterium sediminis]SNR41391.1 Yip1 domain-containing protein [Puniceibacterium sediminis]